MKDFRISAVRQPHSPVPASLDVEGSQSLKSPTPGLGAQQAAAGPRSFKNEQSFESGSGLSLAQRETAPKQQYVTFSEPVRSSERHSSSSSRDTQRRQQGSEVQSKRQPPSTAELEQRLAQACSSQSMRMLTANESYCMPPSLFNLTLLNRCHLFPVKIVLRSGLDIQRYSNVLACGQMSLTTMLLNLERPHTSHPHDHLQLYFNSQDCWSIREPSVM